MNRLQWMIWRLEAREQAEAQRAREASPLLAIDRDCGDFVADRVRAALQSIAADVAPNVPSLTL